ncbi:MAG: hypothetical protein FP825_02245 [Hyphomonas sp.]|uniref:hypothetical protein n=1 Tax=Hyphomonas sp. TaxID=87 RepID=UPI001854EE1B|nr:hypothetical protein [Hyphomonas sp.]MBA3067285.1 hypothetical protein [Hyphomonas sp.]MBU3919912.1 hypothetical protein [Alphaproteobacteria bacterium]MBU4061507.1 hypothetical protein [Alphaproteobacteria bacterium]MBU4163249.1 hypothetical protein [Alphaproteobacteria bacterium]
MSATSELPVARRERFFVYLSWLFVLIAIGGFIPTYWSPLINGTFGGKPVLHVHGAAMLAWVGLYAWQVNLVANRQVAHHRAWGMAGVAVLTAVAFTIVLSAINSMKVAGGIGLRDQALAFSIVSLSGLAVIAVLVALAVRNTGKPDVHKRLMTLSFVPLLEAPMARPFQVLMTPPGVVGPPPVFVTVLPSLVVDLIIVALLVYDKRTLGRFHPVTLWSGGAIIAVQVLCIPLSGTPAWMAIARFVESLAG